jgi:hypothetical protein
VSDIDLIPEIHDAAVGVVRDLSGRRPYQQIAECVLAAVTPLIEAEVRARVAREIAAWVPDPHEPGEGCTECTAFFYAAEIALGES